MKNSIDVILVDDHPIVRRGIAALLEMDGKYRIVAEADDGDEALRSIAETDADLLIMDLSMPRLNGLETLRRLRKQKSDMKVLILSMYDDREFVRQAVAEQVNGYVLKQSMEDELFEALETISRGEQYLSSTLKSATAARDFQNEDNTLTTREREVLQLVAEGHSAAGIAKLMSISPNTVTRHRANIMQKMAVHNQVELVRAGVERGLVILQKPPDVE